MIIFLLRIRKIFFRNLEKANQEASFLFWKNLDEGEISQEGKDKNISFYLNNAKSSEGSQRGSANDVYEHQSVRNQYEDHVLSFSSIFTSSYWIKLIA